MKKVLVGAAVVAALGAGVYYQQTNQTSAAINLAELDYVPADTVFFASQLAPFPYEQYAKLLPATMLSDEQRGQFSEITEALRQEGDATAVFIAEVVSKYEQAMVNQSADKIWGFGSELRYLTYAVGLMPVARIELAEPQTFIATLKEAADKAGLNYQEETLANTAYTRFILEAKQGQSLELITSVQGQWLTLTLSSDMITSDDDLALALATKKPANSLAGTGRLQAYAKKYDWDGSSVNFIDNKALVSALVAEKPSRLGTMIDTFIAKAGKEDALDALRTPGCKKDLPAIATKFPAVVWGTSDLEVTNSYANFDADVIFESSDSDLLGTLATLRGFIPQHVTQADAAILSLGYGIDVSKVGSLTNTLWSSFTQAEFECEPLLMAQEQAQGANPMAIAMATGMFAGVKGVSVTINDLELDLTNPHAPDIKEFSGLVTLSADDPMTLINTAKSLVPELAQVTIPSDGSAVSVSELLEMGMEHDLDVKLAVKGNHITLYTGEQAQQQAGALQNQALEANGLLGMTVNLAPLMEIVVAANEASGQELPPELKALAEQNISGSMTTDINGHGIQLSSSSHIRKN
ncbi:hypothetical protein [Pseudoalteromonas sp. BDTF-M6]|uniref:hypothetical protein n=1 Tax=Pseudoalteromonas sp. BDTF-M6 TaxID=2796132 RepID=UPI001BAE9AE9|nr:hypothetical protein [Pseudoalteromonas sp. BDTF-M6]MBS3796723.1 hypothetical protein [Pseudoalteromonas sp. BDTF-M6]